MEQEKKIKQEREVRYGQWLPVEQRAEGEPDDGYYLVSGKAVCIGEKTCLGKDWDGNDIYEIMEPGCFDKADITDVVCNINHGDGNYAVARTRNNTLSLDIRSDGVYISARLKKDNPRCRQFFEDVSEGLLDRMSFAFIIGEQSYDEKERCYHVKGITKCFDVSAVEFPAYGTTSISSARSAELVSLAEQRAVALKVEQKRKDVSQLVDSLIKAK